MALIIYGNAVHEFSTAVDEILSYVKFVSAAHHMRPRVQKMVDYSSLDGESISTLNGFISHKEYSVEVGFNGLIVTLAGTFEDFVRRLIRDGVQWINTLYDSYEKLGKEIRNQNLLRSGHALATIFEPRDEMSFDYELLCKNLGTCRTDGGELILNAEVFVAGITNIGPGKLDDVLLRVGVKIDWDVFGNNTNIQELLDRSGTRATANALKEWLMGFIIKRNRIAHSDARGIQTTQIEVNTAVDILSTFAPALAQATEDVLKKIYK